MPHMEAIVRATSMCVGNAPVNRRAHGDLVQCWGARLQLWIRHMFMAIGCLVDDSCHHPLWSRLKNLMQTWPQTKFLRAEVQILLLPTVPGFCMERTLPIAQKPCYLGKLVSAWVAFIGTLASPAKEMRGNNQKTNAPRGTIDTWIGCHGTHQGWQPPTYGGHPFWCIVQPMDANPSATLRSNSKPVTERLPKWWRSPNCVDMATITHVNRVRPNVTDSHPNCSRGGSQIAGAIQGGSWQRPYHHRGGGLVWTLLFLVNGGHLGMSTDASRWCAPQNTQI